MSINSLKKNSLDYDNEKQRIITIGGFSLSRGLTLEGLMTSYMYGNTRVYDTLMQKGRWFGYRTGYEDLCTIWMPEESIEWYQSVSDATDELRVTIKRMEEEGAKPIDFGLMVRCDVDALEITARNKMRTAKEFVRNVSLSEEVVETHTIKNDRDVNYNNRRAVDILMSKIENKLSLDTETNKIGVRNVDLENIIDFLENFEVSTFNYTFNREAIIDFLKNYSGNKLKKWDIAFISGSSDKIIEDYGCGFACVKRSFEIENDEKLIRISGKRNRLGSQTDTIFGLNKEQVEEHERIILAYDKERLPDKTKLTEKDYFRAIDRNPLLMIYFIELTSKDEKNDNKNVVIEQYKDSPLIGIGIAIPKLEKSTEYAKYKINIVAQEKGISNSLFEIDDEDSDEE